jgi:hypothetical protein
MDYLLFQLVWWLLGAFGLGLIVGWLSGVRVERDPSQ